MQSSRRFFVQIFVVTAVVLANFIAFTHSASAWPVRPAATSRRRWHSAQTAGAAVDH